MAAQFLGRLDSTVGISQLDLATCGACVVMGLIENMAAGVFCAISV